MKRLSGIKIIWVMAMLLTAISTAHGNNHTTQVQTQIKDRLLLPNQNEATPCDVSNQKTTAMVLDFYSARNYTPAWVDEFGLTPEGSLLISTIENAADQGLPHVTYPFEIINDLTTSTTITRITGQDVSVQKTAQLDITLSTLFFLYSSYLNGGRLSSDYFQDIQQLSQGSHHLAKHLQQALADQSLDLLLSDLSPSHEKYTRLIAAKKQHERIVAAGGWPQIPAGPKLEKGTHDRRILILRERLTLSGDLAEPLKKNLIYFDEDIENAIKRFQRRHGLFNDGIVGPATLRELNVTAKERLVQILVNLERWHLLPHKLGERYIEVNIPDYELSVVEQGKIVKSMRVVVGRLNRPTPILAGQITYLEVNPYWTIPPQIARKDILPKIQQDPAYLIERKIRVFENWQASAAELNPHNIDWSEVGANYFPYKLRQEPYAENALGKVKFMFPNKLSVYLHDTPAKELFSQRQRSFSSGCVRVEKPFDLANYLLEGQNGWNRGILAQNTC